ncbi:unnamed protein product [Caenorhabditis auriculariae]|uniref:Uncharacterized protein n=1 Tax=Caenorhabditis auriculariae TaxID=2777116 RepID=A0A8S1H1F4_9PELO|nr:unnamed protein product [Caenorhabditis auriculariae]
MLDSAEQKKNEWKRGSEGHNEKRIGRIKMKRKKLDNQIKSKRIPSCDLMGRNFPHKKTLFQYKRSRQIRLSTKSFHRESALRFLNNVAALPENIFHFTEIDVQLSLNQHFPSNTLRKNDFIVIPSFYQ